MLSRVFKSGNSLAVRIPKELAIVSASQEVEIEQVGNTLVVRPLEQKSLQGIGELFAMFSDDFMPAGRDHALEQERNWNP
jgi:antitoxin VapB